MTVKQISGEIVIRIRDLSPEPFSPNTHDGATLWYQEYVKPITDAIRHLATPREFSVRNSLYWEILQTNEHGETHWVPAMGHSKDGELVIESFPEEHKDE